MATAVAIAMLFGISACASLISAEDDEGTPLMITAPTGEEPVSCAVFFADNMVYAPQWRLGNFVRIETMVLDTTDYASSREIKRTDTDLYPDGGYADGLDQQAAIIADSDAVLPLTKMVSVSYIEVTVKSDVLETPILFAAGWDPMTREKVIEVNGFGREVNKAGHLIYGTLWDTSGLEEGVYTVEVRLGCVVDGVGVVGEWYDVDYAIGHLYNPEGEEGELLTPEYPYSDLVLEDHVDYSTYKIGVGGMAGDTAWVDLGPLIPQGAGGGNGGDSGGNGNGGDNDNGNGGRSLTKRGR
ncbi:MAG: hypothetical protein MUC90_02475 [Thermoplasmata archaeon]|jgi:hypothetical protein|nr:hypothetical protein [Thermoplasmata archaeon]